MLGGPFHDQAESEANLSDAAMPLIRTARQLLQPGKRALLVRTDGRNFEENPDGTGVTGNWRLRPNPDLDAVIIYQAATQGPSVLKRATLDGFEGPDGHRRYRVRLRDIRHVGVTESRWTDFAEANQNPVRYLVGTANEPVFEIGAKYTRRQIQDILGIPDGQRGGDWDTGYHEHEGEFYIFTHVAGPGRTGHNYGNHFVGDDLVWFGRTGSKVSHPQIQRLTAEDTVVRVFYRTADRDPFVYHGVARVADISDETPVKVVWSFGGSRDRRVEQLPEEVDSDVTHIEGATKIVTVNAYERNPAARRACIAHYGAVCQVCEMEFEKICLFRRS